MAVAAIPLVLHRLKQFNQSFPHDDDEVRQHQRLKAKEENDFREELSRLQSSAASSSHSVGNAAQIPTFYLKPSNPDAVLVLDKVRAAAITSELDLRATEIEEFDNAAHKKVFDLLSCDGARQSIGLDEYIIVMQQFRKWREDRLHDAKGHTDAPVSNTAVKRSLLLPDERPLADILCKPCTQPNLTIEMFIGAARNPTGRVEVKPLFQKFAKSVSLLKTEAELIMWDSDNDGRLTEDDVEGYVKYLVQNIASLSSLPEEQAPFYCCAVSRRLFWTLDPSSRGYISIADLVRSPVMDEWLELQQTHEDVPRNWFGLGMTSQLYEKFLTLDTKETGMLTADDMKKYKKGIPMVADDGLPPHVSPLSSTFIDRVFETMPMYKSEMDYKNFVDFVIAVEFLPQCSRPNFFWNIFDVDQTGVLTPMSVLHFFRETHKKLTDAGVEAASTELILSELFDIIPTREPLTITREEFVQCNQCGLFSTLLIDCLAFWTYENRDQK